MEYDIKIDQSGSKFYYKKGTKLLHRKDGPAIEYSYGDREWWVDGKKHRLDGPAREWTNGYKEWWINGAQLSPEKESILNKWWEKNKVRVSYKIIG